ncbi:MAG: hypothetical protein WC878_07240 [Candidatus Paceibacterota bacterium]|jgi:hypothetical protein
MNTYKETLEAARKIIETLAISEEDKAMLMERIPHLSFDALEVFVWTLEKDPSDISTILQKTRQWMAAQTDPVEIQKAIEKDKKELEEMMASEGVLI